MIRSVVALVSVASIFLPRCVPVDDEAIGRGNFQAGGDFEFIFNARSGPQGEDPSGIMILERADEHYTARAEVFCLAVSRNRATIVGDIFHSTGFPGYEELVFIVNDNLFSGTLDTFSYIVKQRAGQGLAECFPQTTPNPISFGDIEVIDGRP
jgi:hypothetical protein